MEIDDHKHIDEGDGEDHAKTKAGETVLHGFDLAANCEGRSLRELAIVLVENFVDICCDPAKIAALGTDEHIKDWLHVVMVGDAG